MLANECAPVFPADCAGILREAFALGVGGDIAGEKIDELAAKQSEAVAGVVAQAFERGKAVAGAAAGANAPLDAGGGEVADAVGVAGGTGGVGVGDDVAEVFFEDAAMAAAGPVGANFAGISPPPDCGLAHAKEFAGGAEG